MDSDVLAGKVAVVTGAGRGLGRAMALGLVRHGAKVTATAMRQPEEVERVAAEAKAVAGADALLPLVADVTNETDCQRVIDETIKAFGGVHVLVNNAGRGMREISETFATVPTKFWEADSDTWRLIIDINVNGPFLMSKAVIPHMMERGWGRILQISMDHNTMRRGGFSPYGPSKAALECEVVVWSQELEGSGITVNSLRPGGLTQSGMVSDTLPEEVRKHILDPEILVTPLVWLSTEASDGVTGRRFSAKDWDTSLEPSEAARRIQQLAGWTESLHGQKNT